MRLLIDTVFQDSIIGVHPNENTATVWLRTEDLIRLIGQSGGSLEWIEG